MNLIEQIKEEKIYGIIREDSPERSYRIARAYIEGGIKFLELNCPLETTEKLAKEDVIIAQGGIITTMQAQKAISAGADIISSPIFQTNLIRFASCNKTLLIPSVTTPNEAYNAWRARMPLIKIYPVSEMGGVKYIKELVKPMPFLNLLPCGSIKLNEIKDYLKAGAVSIGIGREFYAQESYERIVETVSKTIRSLNDIKSA